MFAFIKSLFSKSVASAVKDFHAFASKMDAIEASSLLKADAYALQASALLEKAAAARAEASHAAQVAANVKLLVAAPVAPVAQVVTEQGATAPVPLETPALVVAS